MSPTEILRNSITTLAEIHADGPIEITSIEGWHAEASPRRPRLLTMFAAGARPGAYYGEYTPWPVELEDGAAVELVDWLLDRHDTWPGEDPGGLFERVGLFAPMAGVVRKGTRRIPRRQGRACLLGRSWAAALDGEDTVGGVAVAELVVAATALGLLVDIACPKEKDRPTRRGDGWGFPGEIRDARGELTRWIASMLSDIPSVERVVDLSVRAWESVTGAPIAVPARRTAPRSTEDGVDDGALVRAEPLLRFTLDLIDRARAGTVPAAEVLDQVGGDDHALLCVAAGLGIAGIRAGASELAWSADSADLRTAFGTGPLRVSTDATDDPLAMTREVTQGFTQPVTEHARHAAFLLDLATDNRSTDGDHAHRRSDLVPAAVAVVTARRATGSWNERAARAINAVHDAVEREFGVEPSADNTRTADLAARPGRPDDLGGLASLAAESYFGSWSVETVQRLARRALGQNSTGADLTSQPVGFSSTFTSRW